MVSYKVIRSSSINILLIFSKVELTKTKKPAISTLRFVVKAVFYWTLG